MDTPRPHPASYWLLGGTLLLFLALLILPMTHWIAANQSVRLFVMPNDYVVLLKDLGVKEFPYTADLRGVERARQETIQRNPGDYDIQLAAALAYYPPPDTPAENFYTARLAPLRALKARFPEHRSTLSAHILRYACSHLHRHHDHASRRRPDLLR